MLLSLPTPPHPPPPPKKKGNNTCLGFKQVADQLENLLDDDNDMAEMYLTQKLDARLLDQASPKEGNNSAALEDVDERCKQLTVVC